MQKRHRDFIIKVAAVSSLVFSILLSIGIIGLMIALAVKSGGFNVAKLFIVFLILIIFMALIMTIGIAMYEFFQSYIKMEIEVEQLEKEVEQLEKEVK